MAKEKVHEKPKSESQISVKPINPVIPGGLLGNMGMKQETPKIDAPKIDIEKIKGKLEDFKKKVVKKYNFTTALSILPPQASAMFEEEEAVPKEVAETHPIHVMMLMPEEHYKNLEKIKAEVIKFAKETKENLWVHIKTEVDLWNYGLDSRYEMLDAIAASFPLYDKGFLGALRVANIHKSLVLRKFEKYVASYVIFGSLVRGTADATSDVDTIVIIDDTDVKRMPRMELLERLRGIIYDYIREATALAGVKNILNVQVWLLTDFWQRVKDAEPVAFTGIRDGIPFWDRGTFIPWKLLLKLGKIKPSPEAVDAYMKQAEQTDEFVKRRMIDTMVDIYFGTVTPVQAMMMLAGEAPPVPKVLVEEVRKVLVEREGLLSKKDLDFIEEMVKLYKGYEYGTVKEISGTKLDGLMKSHKEFLKSMGTLRVKLEKKMNEKSAKEIYAEVFKLLKTVLGDKSEKVLITTFDKEIVKKGKISPRFLPILKNISTIDDKVKSGKITLKEADRAKKDAEELIKNVVEYAQRANLVCVEKGSMQIAFDNGHKKGELVLMGEEHNYIIDGKLIRRIEKDKLKEVTKEEFEKNFAEHKAKLSTKVSGHVFDVLKKELGAFEIEF